MLLTGNGTLFVNNTFVEWAAVQALRRAQPRILVTRFGVRDKLKPFSSLLLFSQPRASDQIPLLEDPVGSFVDAEQLSYYVWLNAEKSPAYRTRTLYLFLAEGIDEMLAIRSDVPAATAAALPAATLRGRVRDDGAVAGRAGAGVVGTADRFARLVGAVREPPLPPRAGMAGLKACATSLHKYVARAFSAVRSAGL